MFLRVILDRGFFWPDPVFLCFESGAVFFRGSDPDPENINPIRNPAKLCKLIENYALCGILKSTFDIFTLQLILNFVRNILD